MNVLFLTLLDFNSFDAHNIYSDLLREFIRNGHRVCCISPFEDNRSRSTQLLRFGNNSILKLKIGNVQKVNPIKKGINTLCIEPLFIRGIQKYYSDVKFDLVLYVTPPITFARVIEFVKKRDGAWAYLMLKDIFPQNSVDLGMLSRKGIKGWIYRYFCSRERSLYAFSDRIGCMSQANVDYVLHHHPYLPRSKVEICPNAMDVRDILLREDEIGKMRDQYGIPRDKMVFVYGGNLGRPQDVPFVVSCLKACAAMENVCFVIAGNGTDRHILEEYMAAEQPGHVVLLGQIPKDEYDRMIACCDVGLIFLDHRFTIPNFPSRLLSYMQAGLPVLACTDPVTDVGRTVAEGGFGWWCESSRPEAFAEMVSGIRRADEAMKQRELAYLRAHFSAGRAYEIIISSIGGRSR